MLLFVGRFTEVKRIPLLIRAYARARERFERRAPLVIWGGFPGEWEGEHPHTVASSARASRTSSSSAGAGTPSSARAWPART